MVEYEIFCVLLFRFFFFFLTYYFVHLILVTKNPRRRLRVSARPGAPITPRCTLSSPSGRIRREIRNYSYCRSDVFSFSRLSPEPAKLNDRPDGDSSSHYEAEMSLDDKFNNRIDTR
ncbi:hypothetical protein PUN28_005539 [Cardiocondyla obscurior]|uniref:Uncharacterized protein n=1 Tax=Cardiocondyla obscurior TaxID=286306 RepID=A0AAW2GIE8_9HYME